MSASLINFESARVKEEQRQQERKARQAILEKAQQEYEARQQKEEAARQRGEHTWMLPSVEAKLTKDSESGKKKKKKKDKKKKKKKEKKSKKHKKKDSSSSSSSESEEDEGEEGSMWVERTTSTTSSSVAAPVKDAGVKGLQLSPQENSEREPVKRDGWMEMTSLFGTFSRDEMREKEGTSRKKAKEEEKKRKIEADKPGSHALELNPYYKDGGTGLPQNQKEASTPAAAPASHVTGLDAAWLRKALQRAKEQASAEGRPLEEIAAQRWGSLAKFNELLAEAEGRGKHRESVPRQQDRRRDRRSRSRERDRMRDNSRKRDRTKSRSRERVRDDSRKRDRRRSRSRSQERERSKGVRRERSGSGDRRNRSRSMERSRRSKERRHHGRRSSSSSSDSSSSSSRDSSRSSSRNRSKQRGQKDKEPREDSPRLSHKLLKPSEESGKGSALAMRFQRPGEQDSRRSSQSTMRGSVSSSSSSSSSRWQKKEYQQAVREKEHQNRRSPTPSSSSSSSSSSEDESADLPPRPTTTGQREEPATIQLPAPAVTPLTDKEMNELAAKVMKAELVGNDAQAAKLKARLEAAREVRAAAVTSRRDEGRETTQQREEVVVLTRTDSSGMSRPLLGTGPGAEAGTKKRSKVKTHGQDGQRARYFPDDDHYSLKNMFEKEKGTTATEQNTMFEEAAMKNSERLNDEYDIDDMFMSKTALRDTAAKQADKERKRAILEHKRVERSLENCHWCFDNKEMPKHLIVALGTKCYVSLPSHQSLTPGHCCISPIHHISCSIQAEEDLWDEVQNFRKSLVKMFASKGEDCIFFETVKRLRNFPHMVMHCVPLPKETGDMAPIYFKKAIMECEREWAQNKKLVDLKGRDVRRAVPKGLPYFFVDFAMDAGFAHVIEDEKDFPNNFAQEIVGGMLDLDCNLWRKPRKENFDNQRRKVMEFSRWYKEFDPTQEN